MAKHNRICSVEDCCKTAAKRGWCIAHYKRWERYGDPNGGGTARGAGLAWLEDRQDYKSDECLTWPFGKRGKCDGRGCVKFRGKTQSASRVMCIIAHGEPPTPDYDAAHSRGNGHLGCVNPKHLRWATRAENMADCIEHGRTNRGERCGASKLTLAQVLEIKRSSEKGVRLAERYNVHRTTISEIRLGKKWAWV